MNNSLRRYADTKNGSFCRPDLSENFLVFEPEPTARRVLPLSLSPSLPLSLSHSRCALRSFPPEEQ